MARYKYQNYLSVSKNGSFDLTLSASSPVPCGGIYRCTGCGTEIALEGIGFLPDRTHHPHKVSEGSIQWQLIVATVSLLPEPYLHGAA
jgi:hypothetical protein